MEYKFVSAECGWKLEDEVNALIAKGWVPIGGVSVAVVVGIYQRETEWVYAQAMTRLPGTQ